MALAFQSSESVKQALFEELQNILSADKDIRTSAEAKIKHLEFTEGKCRLFFPVFKKNVFEINSTNDVINDRNIICMPL